MGGGTFYTYKGAARRVGRSVRAIKRWRHNGMPMQFDDEGRRVVEETVLLAWFRDRLSNWPAHQYRLRRALQERARHAEENE